MSGACEYKPHLRKEDEVKGEDKKLDIIRLAGLAIITIFIAWLQLVQPLWLADITIILAVIVGGFPLYKESFHALKKGRVNMELSMVIAIAAALALSQFLPAIVITLFALLSEFIEGFIVSKGRQNIQTLYKLSPRKAIVKYRVNDVDAQGTEKTETVDVNKVRVGDTVLVREGDVVPIDGHIIKGYSTIDQSSITGESMPVEKGIGDTVFAGTINQSQQIEVVSDKPSSDTTFAKIIHLIEEAEASKAPIQKLSEKMAARVIQFAIGLSVLTYLLTQNVTSTLSVVVVAGACGLAIGTPIALLATIGKLSKNGVIVKGGVQIELLKDTETVVFDKTGTLTYGKPVVSQVISFKPNEIEPKSVLEYAAIAERNINHPLAKAIEEKAHEENILLSPDYSNNDIGSSDLPSNSNLVTTIGKGVTRIHKGQRISIGNLKFVEELLSAKEDSASFSKPSSAYSSLQIMSRLLSSNGNGGSEQGYLEKESRIENDNSTLASSTTSFVVVDGQIIGAVLFEDKLRQEVREALSEVKAMGIHTVMLTGDNERIAKRIAEEAGIDEYHANLLPHDKVSRIEDIVSRKNHKDNSSSDDNTKEKWKIRKKKGIVVMIGDGINDAPALAKADVGIAMGKTGTDVAIETADVVLMTEDLLKIPYIIRTSKHSISTVQQNFFGTLSIDGIGFVLAITGNINPLIAAFIHVASEIIFIVNSARLVSEKSTLTKDRIKN